MSVFQIARSTAVADEAIGNVRTVRAFAMEATETRCVDLQRVSLIQFSSSLNVIFLH